MATAGALASNANLFTALAGIPKTLFGSSSTQTTSGGTQTQQTMMSQDAVNAMLKDLMEDDSRGLARVASGARVPGMYNTTSQQLMINDLLARSAAQVEKARAPTVTTKSPTVTKMEEPGLLSGSTGGLIGLGAAGLALGTSAGRKLLGIDELLGGAASGMSGAASTFGLGAETFAGGLDVGTAMSGLDVGSAFGASTASDFFGMADSYSWAADAGSAMASGADAAAGAGSMADFFTVDIGGTAVPWLGSAMHLMEGDVEGAIGSAAGATLGNMILPGVGGWIGGAIGGSLCFITTAVCHTMNKPDDCYELNVLREFRDTWMTANHPELIEQYYAEAPMIVSRISAMPEAAKIFNDFNRDFIQPAVKHIEEGENEIAFRTYMNLFNYAKEIAGSI